MNCQEMRINKNKYIFHNKIKKEFIKLNKKTKQKVQPKRDLTRNLTKEEIQMANSILKDTQHMSLENAKFKQDTTIHLFDQLKSKTQITPNAGKDMKQQKLSFIASENAKHYSCFVRRFGSFLKR